jgi:hypothetical protein
MVPIKRKCKYCGEVETFIRPRPDTIHGYEVCCFECNAHIGWAGKPKNDKKHEERPPCPSPEDLEIDWCQMCLLPKNMLGENETLHTHHIDDEPKNNERLNLFVVCTSCHTLIHHQRTYRYNHYIKLVEVY